MKGKSKCGKTQEDGESYDNDCSLNSDYMGDDVVMSGKKLAQDSNRNNKRT